MSAYTEIEIPKTLEERVAELEQRIAELEATRPTVNQISHAIAYALDLGDVKAKELEEEFKWH